jgi:hypothetical protein
MPRFEIQESKGLRTWQIYLPTRSCLAVDSREMAIDVPPSALVASFSAKSGTKHRDRFEELVQALKEALGPCSGLTSDDVDVAYLTQLMTLYRSADGGWQRYFLGDVSRGYTRNLVDDGNGKSNLVCDGDRTRLPRYQPMLTNPDTAGTCVGSQQG